MEYDENVMAMVTGAAPGAATYADALEMMQALKRWHNDETDPEARATLRMAALALERVASTLLRREKP